MNNHPPSANFSEGSDEELAFLYQLGLALASGRDLFSTLLTLQTTILKLIPADAMFIAIHDKTTDIVEYPIYFEVGSPGSQPSRQLGERPGLTGAVIYNGKTLYLPDMNTDEVIRMYAPVDDDKNFVMHTFLGIPLIVNDTVFGFYPFKVPGKMPIRQIRSGLWKTLPSRPPLRSINRACWISSRGNSRSAG